MAADDIAMQWVGADAALIYFRNIPIAASK